MALISGSAAVEINSKLNLKIHYHDRSRPVDHNAIRSFAVKVPRRKICCSTAARSRGRSGVCAGRSQVSYNDHFAEEPFWSKAIKEASRALKSLFIFLLEQPSQLKYIEWPSFQSTLKTALLTLVLVAFLIVALASVDSALGYLLGLLLRKPA